MNTYRVNWNIKKSITLSVTSNESLKTSTVLCVIWDKCGSNEEKIFKIIYIFTEATEILKILGLSNKMN